MKTIVLKLTEELPPEIIQPGVVVKTEQEKGTTDEGTAFNDLAVTVRLDAADSTGKKFEVTKRYNLNGRGVTLFRKDFKTTQGRNLTAAELKAFDPDALFNNKPVNVRIKHIKDGAGSKAVIEKFIAPAAAGEAKA